jgi:hypothetical protein
MKQSRNLFPAGAKNSKNSRPGQRRYVFAVPDTFSGLLFRPSPFPAFQLAGPPRQLAAHFRTLLRFDREVTERSAVAGQLAVQGGPVLLQPRSDFLLGDLQREQLR